MIKYFLSITLLLCLFVSCKQIDKSSVKGLITEHAMVVSARAEASEIGSAILKKGGNAFDAMCATQLALAVAYPFAGNIGGGGSGGPWRGGGGGGGGRGGCLPRDSDAWSDRTRRRRAQPEPGYGRRGRAVRGDPPAGADAGGISLIR